MHIRLSVLILHQVTIVFDGRESLLEPGIELFFGDPWLLLGDGSALPWLDVRRIGCALPWLGTRSAGGALPWVAARRFRSALPWLAASRSCIALPRVAARAAASVFPG